MHLHSAESSPAQLGPGVSNAMLAGEVLASIEGLQSFAADAESPVCTSVAWLEYLGAEALAGIETPRRLDAEPPRTPPTVCTAVSWLEDLLTEVGAGGELLPPTMDVTPLYVGSFMEQAESDADAGEEREPSQVGYRPLFDVRAARASEVGDDIPEEVLTLKRGFPQLDLDGLRRHAAEAWAALALAMVTPVVEATDDLEPRPQAQAAPRADVIGRRTHDGLVYV